MHLIERFNKARDMRFYFYKCIEVAMDVGGLISYSIYINVNIYECTRG
jgi:hypothetical protein